MSHFPTAERTNKKFISAEFTRSAAKFQKRGGLKLKIILITEKKQLMASSLTEQNREKFSRKQKFLLKNKIVAPD